MKQTAQNIHSKNNLKKISPTAILVLENGKIFNGFGLGYEGSATGEVCFNTSITGYQEILTDPSYFNQLITFTFPHIGIVGTNKIDYVVRSIDSILPTSIPRTNRFNLLLFKAELEAKEKGIDSYINSLNELIQFYPELSQGLKEKLVFLIKMVCF